MRSSTYCTERLEDFYEAMMDAKNSCDQMEQQYSNCTILYDMYCDGGNYTICKEGTAIEKSSTGSCTYYKPGNISTFHQRSVEGLLNDESRF